MSQKLYLLSVGLHIVAAMTWIGGMIFLVTVIAPALRRLEDRATAVLLFRDAGKRFRLVGWLCFAILFATGWTNLSARGIGMATISTAAFWSSPFGEVLAYKLGVVLAILLLSALHDFLLGPKATAALSLQPASPEAVRLRAIVIWLGRLNLFLALIVTACGIMLVRGRPW